MVVGGHSKVGCSTDRCSQLQVLLSFHRDVNDGLQLARGLRISDISAGVGSTPKGQSTIDIVDGLSPTPQPRCGDVNYPAFGLNLAALLPSPREQIFS